MSRWKLGKSTFFRMIAGGMLTLLGASLLIAGKPAPAPALYTFTDLGGFSGLTSVQSGSRAVSNVDDDGLLTVVGDSSTSISFESKPAAWTVTESGTVVSVADLGAPPTASSTWAFAVNDHSVSVGAVVSGPPFVGFVSVRGVGTFLLPTFGGLRSAGYGINNSGAIVGHADGAGATRWGALWHVDDLGNITAPINLGTFLPNDINDTGVMAGEQGGMAAIAWFVDVEGTPTLQTQSLGMLAPTHRGSSASAINNFGEVVGTSNAPGSDSSSIAPQAFIWRAGTMTPLGTLGGATSSATSINDSSQVVGGSADRQGHAMAYLWQNGKINNLNTLAGLDAGTRVVTAMGINNRGQIVGGGYVPISKRTTELHGYLLTPKP